MKETEVKLSYENLVKAHTRLIEGIANGEYIFTH